ncbi:N-acetyl-D-Glu racemase DgcA [uncultured Photobacterium sp.]|uniref:N-acetyl-D-Glu racemase DgcA n=1 Tax=uncultured Photobacterium sp. TaxID=173973 RepID=UPI0026066AF0|nr:N-acetyl-D-Glu racemase DgcA [uncultured Photobacterium sp.]
MKINAVHEQFPLARPFTTSRDTRTHQDVVTVTISKDGISALGECTPYPRYGENIKSVIKQIHSLNKLPAGVALNRTNLQQLLPAGAARNAVDCALWRLEYQQQFPYQIFEMKPEIITAMTVSLDAPKVMAQQAKELCKQGARLLKVKLNDEQIIERVKAVRTIAPDAELIIDANEAWGELELEALFTQLSPFGIRMIEQPVPKGQDAKLLGINHPITLCADESCHTCDDLDELIGCYEMVNIKLDKSGGLTEALALEEKAHKLGFKVMIGCMVGSSLAIEPALPIASRAEIIDLDGPLLIKNDRADGLLYQGGAIQLGSVTA